MGSEKTYKRDGRYEFTDGEIAQMENEIVGRINQLTAVFSEIDTHREKIKDLKAKAATLGAENKNVAKKIEDGYDIRPLECKREKDYDRRVFIFYDIATGAEVCREQMTHENFQMSIDED